MWWSPDGLISMLPGLGWLGVWVALTNAEGNLGGSKRFGWA